MKRFVRFLSAAVLVILVCVLAGTFIPQPFLAAAAPDKNSATRRILLLSNPIHTDLAIPLDDDTRAGFAFLEEFGIPVSNPQARWLIIGWGGRAFYLETPTWADLKPMPVLRALTIDRSVLHVDVTGPIDETHPAVSGLDLEPARFDRLLVFIQDSFTRKTGRVSVIEGRSYGDTDRFFEAPGYFNALFGCNTWTAHALREGGLRTGLWNPVPQTLRLSLRLFN